MMLHTPTTCPVVKNQTELQDLEPLLHVLEQNTLPLETAQFPRGSLLPSGSLDLCKQNLGVQGCERIVEVLRSQNVVHTLLLGTNAIGNEGAAKVADLIRCGSLESVYLGCNLIEADGVEQITNALLTDQKVKALWLKRNPIGAQGIRLLSQMLKVNSSLRTLDVVNTSPDHDSMLELLEVIATHPSLEYLYLSGNGLDADEAPALARCLEQSQLKGLYASVNHLGDAGARVLAEGLKTNTRLKFLSLASNFIGNDGVNALTEALCDHPSLTSLDLGYSPSTKVLGTKANEFGDACFQNVNTLLESSRTVQDLNLVPNQFSEDSKLALLETANASKTLKRFLFDDKRSLREIAPTHVDAQGIRSVYR